MVHFPLCKSKYNQNTILFSIHQSTVWIKDCLSSIKITEVCELLIEDTESGPAAHVKAVEEVSDPLDASSDELNVLPVHPVSLENVLLIKTIKIWIEEVKKILTESYTTLRNPLTDNKILPFSHLSLALQALPVRLSCSKRHFLASVFSYFFVINSFIEILLSKLFASAVCLDYWLTKPWNAAYYYHISSAAGCLLQKKILILYCC